ncbi:MAG TPA: phosphatidate cytidylyltransferase [Candidatus Acidoferrum sp.]|jgi:phosphatidate cytidylyltransferase|nr:phosphatidate cytidylyltransferase [Candidatus Acidoferrum sp.]
MTWKRVATAAVLIPVVVGLVLWGSTIVVALVLALVMLLALFEYFALGDAMGHRAHRFWTATCALIILYLQWLTTAVRWGEFGGITYPARLAWLFHRFFPRAEDAVFLFVLGIAVITLATRRPIVEALPSAGISSSGLLLVAFPLTYAIRLHALGREGPRLLLFVLVLIWASDSAAYFAGRALGKHPFAPHLSPKKTWEGSIAGFASSIVVAFAFTRWLSIPIVILLGGAALGNIAGQIGDLLESAYKRSAGVKDSGALLPGHGGMLDRIDALILAIPVVWYYFVLLYQPSV